MKDEAVAAVIGMMLILGIIVTFLSIMNAVYIPSMKAQSEVIHLDSVRHEFLAFSSDIENTIAEKRAMKKSRILELGGGDVLLNPLKSSGTLSIETPSFEDQYMTISTGSTEFFGNSISYTYKPVGNFWIEQGYRWEDGVVNVTAGPSRETWLEFTNAKAALEKINETANTFLEIKGERNSSIPTKCSSITISYVNLTPDPDYSFSSGNGEGSLNLNSSVVREIFPNADHLIITVRRGKPLPYAVFFKAQSDLETLDNEYDNIGGYYEDPVSGTLQINIDNSLFPVDTVIERNEIRISAL